jgi:hypothetical protein
MMKKNKSIVSVRVMMKFIHSFVRSLAWLVGWLRKSGLHIRRRRRRTIQEWQRRGRKKGRCGQNAPYVKNYYMMHASCIVAIRYVSSARNRSWRGIMGS